MLVPPFLCDLMPLDVATPWYYRKNDLMDNPSWQPAGLAANALAPELCAAFFRRVYLDTVRVFPKSPSFDNMMGRTI